jgi:hypothetical protein
MTTESTRIRASNTSASYKKWRNISLIVIALLILSLTGPIGATQIERRSNSYASGTAMVVLPNGNIVVTTRSGSSAKTLYFLAPPGAR